VKCITHTRRSRGVTMRTHAAITAGQPRPPTPRLSSRRTPLPPSGVLISYRAVMRPDWQLGAASARGAEAGIVCSARLGHSRPRAIGKHTPPPANRCVSRDSARSSSPGRPPLVKAIASNERVAGQAPTRTQGATASLIGDFCNKICIERIEPLRRALPSASLGSNHTRSGRFSSATCKSFTSLSRCPVRRSHNSRPRNR
jgi:hypothetical protein